MSCQCVPVATASIESFTPYVLPQVRDVPDQLAQQMIRQSIIEFAAKTHVLKRTFIDDLQAGVSDYCLECDECVTIHSIVSVHANGERLPALERPPQDYDIGYYFAAPSDLFLASHPTYDVARGLEVHAVTIPGQDCCEFPAILYTQYAETIADGAIYRLAGMHGAPWYSPQQQAFFGKKYFAALGMAMAAGKTNHDASPLLARRRRWV